MKELTFTLTSTHLADILDSVLTSMSKTEKTKVKKAAIKNALLRQPKATKISTRTVSKEALAKIQYAKNLKTLGYTGKGAPSTTLRQSALDMLTTEELASLNYGHNPKFAKTAPVFYAVTRQKNISDLRA